LNIARALASRHFGEPAHARGIMFINDQITDLQISEIKGAAKRRGDKEDFVTLKAVTYTLARLVIDPKQNCNHRITAD